MKLLIVIGIVGAIILAGVMLNPKSRGQVTGNADDVTVEVITSGRFTGSIGTSSSQRSIDGTGNATFTLQGAGSRANFVAAVVKESTNTGPISVELKGCPDGKRHIQSSSATYGGVTVTC